MKDAVVVEIPMRVSNRTNGSHGHWAVGARERKRQRQHVLFAMRAARPDVRRRHALVPCVVTLIRVAPRALDDHDGLRAAFKPIADQVTKELGLPNDRDPRIEFRYAQERGRPREYGVRIQIEPRAPVGRP